MGEDHQDHGEATEGVDVFYSIFIHGISCGAELNSQLGSGAAG